MWEANVCMSVCMWQREIRPVRMCAGVFRQITPYTPLLLPNPTRHPSPRPSTPTYISTRHTQACTQCSHRGWSVMSWRRISEWMQLFGVSRKVGFYLMMMAKSFLKQLYYSLKEELA